MILTYQGTEYAFDETQISVDEWRELKRKYKMTPAGFEKAVAEADPDAMTFLYWAMLRQAGQAQLLLGDHLKPDIIALNSALAAASTEDAEGEGEPPDPTRPLLPSSPAASASGPATPGPAPQNGQEVTAPPIAS